MPRLSRADRPRGPRSPALACWKSPVKPLEPAKIQCWDQPVAQQHASANKGVDWIHTKLDQTWKGLGVSLRINQRNWVTCRGCEQASPVSKWWLPTCNTPHVLANIHGREERSSDGKDRLCSSREIIARSNPHPWP